MTRNRTLWIVALFITAAAAIYQRVTGPTYPLAGSVLLKSAPVAYRLDRSHSGAGDAPVVVTVPDDGTTGTLLWRHFRSEEPWRTVAMERERGALKAAVPHQLPAVKLEYRIRLSAAGEEALLPADEPVVIRFRGDVPAAVLVVHIAAMLCAMLLSTRGGLEVLAKEPKYAALTWWAIGALAAGGMILGPVVQKHAFGACWTGWPVGTDLTDNKTLIALIGWLGAALALRTVPRPGLWVALAAALMLGVFMIPHSLRGSEREVHVSPSGSLVIPADPAPSDEKRLDKPAEMY